MRRSTHCRSQQSGFTLVEIAIVLVIIGLLLGGILKGQELINSAKVKNLANDFRVIPTYIYAYQDKFKSLPGDDAQVDARTWPTRHAPAPAARVGNGVIDGPLERCRRPPPTSRTSSGSTCASRTSRRARRSSPTRTTARPTPSAGRIGISSVTTAQIRSQIDRR